MGAFVAAVAVVAGLAMSGSALAADSAAPPPGPIELNNQGVEMAAQARYAEAEEFYRQALGRLAASSPVAGHVLDNLAALYLAKGDAAEAESCALRAGAMLGETDRTGNRVLLASIYVEERRFAEARTLLEPALPAASGQLAFNLNATLAAAALGAEKLEDAQEFCRRALEIAATSLAPNHPGIASVWNNLGQIYRFQGRYLEAETAYRKAVEIWTAARGPAHPLVARGLLNLAAFEHERGRERAAEELYGRAAGILDRTIGADALQTLIARNELGDVLRAEGRYAASEQASRATLPAIRKLLPESDPRVLRALANYARLLAATKRQSDANALWTHIRLVAGTLASGSLR
jgi:tetratricopeptide (TPR) repeat protein